MALRKPSRLFLFSGLGADERVFSFLKLKKRESLITPIKWLKPLDKNEKLHVYASRLIEHYKINENVHYNPPLLLGLSFGGVVAQEVSNQIQNSKVCLVSSLSTSSDFPFWYKFNSYVPFHRAISSTEAIKPLHSLLSAFLGAKSSQHKEILRNIMNDTDIDFVHWAIDRMLLWKQLSRSDSLKLQIHGDSDLILPYCSNEKAFTIKQGTHLMIMTHHEQISKLINDHFLNSDENEEGEVREERSTKEN